ncbi:MAG TPA: sn-glycerol-3-phosphate ABC transporter ATP-binding protein UgpC [Gemmatimonadaceae bacterium]|nr:sn-glycerol-3-phosphate ABC transporter ATP-binding protein UgpC [Gemmatimonadaceae bacterium]
MASVQLEGVQKIYDAGSRAHIAVHNIDLEIGDGELVVLVGPSGCGKTTTLRMIAGLESVTRGTLRIGGRVVNDVPPKDRDIAMVFQNYALYPHMTVRDNMGFALTLRHVGRAEVDARVRDAATILGIEELLDRRPRQLSGGQRQRVALGRAIVRQPQVFLFDEPLSNLDAKLRVQMRREIARLHRQLSATMVYVTHDQVEAMTLGNRIVVMNAGRVQQVGAPLELYEQPDNAFVATFIGSPPMNLVPARLTQDRAMRVVADQGAFALPAPTAWARLLDGGAERQILFGIRPEHLRVESSGSGNTITARLDLVEPMGAELYLSLRAGPYDLMARIPPQSLPPIGTEIVLGVDLAHAHCFDAGTTVRLS